MSLQIRDATEGDVRSLAELLVEINDLHVEALPNIYRPIKADDRTANYLRDQLAERDRQLFAAEHAGTLAGFIVVALHVTPFVLVYRPRRYAEIEVLVVSKPFRRQGIGRALVQRAHQWATDQGVEHVELVVLAFNEEARAFYEHLGYSTLHRRMGRSLPAQSDERDAGGHEP